MATANLSTTRAAPYKKFCPTCGVGMDGRKVFCTDGCRTACGAPGCERKAIGTVDYCAPHMSSIYKHGKLPEKPWAKEKLCLVCGKTEWQRKGREVCSARCQQLLSRNGGIAPESFKQCARCTTIIDLSVRHPSGRKRRADIKVCDSCHKAKYTRHRVSVTELADRDGTDCKICREPVDMSRVFPDMFRASVDHILPYASGGSHDPENLQLSHLWCNLVKQNRPGFVI